MIASLKSRFARVRAQAGRADGPILRPELLKTLVPLIVLAVGVTALVLMFMWRDQSNYKPVFGAREKVAVSDMIGVLDAEGIRYRLHPESGQVLVSDADLGRARLALAGKGVTAQLPAGLELMDRNDPLGVSQFVQDVRFRRGLEGELAQSIMALEAVETARVHLSIAKSSSFVSSDGAKSSASVVVGLKPGRTLTPEQIASAVNLVAGSVASLSPERVSLVDQAGNLLSSRVDLTDGFQAVAGNEAARHYQDEARRNVRDLLAPVLGEDNYKVSVTAEVDNDRIEETHEKFGEDPRVTNEAMREEQDPQRLAVGVPGSLSNRPVAAAAAAAAANAGDAQSARKNATTRQFAYDRSITQIKRSRGRLTRLSVAVVLNASAAPTPSAGWSANDLVNVERLIRNGLGISAERGDELVVSALPFPARPAPQAWWEQRDNLWDIGTVVAYLLMGILAIVLVVRPLMKLIQAALTPRPMLPALAGAGAEVQGGASAGFTPLMPVAAESQHVDGAPLAVGASPMPVVPLLENYDLPPPGSPVDVMVDHLKVLSGKEPERVAEVVKQWVQKHGQQR